MQRLPGRSVIEGISVIGSGVSSVSPNKPPHQHRQRHSHFHPRKRLPDAIARSRGKRKIGVARMCRIAPAAPAETPTRPPRTTFYRGANPLRAQHGALGGQLETRQLDRPLVLPAYRPPRRQHPHRFRQGPPDSRRAVHHFRSNITSTNCSNNFLAQPGAAPPDVSPAATA